MTNSGDVSVDINQIATDLNEKADRDFLNVANAGKVLASGWGMPDTTKYIDLTLGASGSQYIAPSNGWVVLAKRSTATGQYIEITSVGFPTIQWSSASQIMGVYLPVRKDSLFTIYYSADGALNYFKFVYAVGSESEA